MQNSTTNSEGSTKKTQPTKERKTWQQPNLTVLHINGGTMAALSERFINYDYYAS